MTIHSTIAPAAEADQHVWEQAFSSYRAIKTEDDAFTPGWWTASKACDAECAAVPHITLRPDAHTGRHDAVSTADRLFVANARKTVAGVDAGTIKFDDVPSLQDHLTLCRDLVAAAAERDAVVRGIRDRYNMDFLDQRAEDLGEAICEATSVLMAIPSPHLAALRWKLDHTLEPNNDGSTSCWEGHYVAQLRSDILRLLPVEA